MTLSLADLRAARSRRDPHLARFVSDFFEQSDPDEETTRPEDRLDLNGVLTKIRAQPFFRRSLDEQRTERDSYFRQLAEKDSGLTDLERQRLAVHDFFAELWNSEDIYDRDALLGVLRMIPLVYGPWRAVKRIFKEAEERQDWEVFAVLAARFDAALANDTYVFTPGPQRRTIAYLARRAWRTLRQLGGAFPALYPGLAARILAEHRVEEYSVHRTWILCHILYHGTKKYGTSSFQFYGSWSLPKSLDHRAFAESWKRSPGPLLLILEGATVPVVLKMATDALKSDFRSSLKEIDAAWIVRLIERGLSVVDDFAVWLLQQSSRFEQARFREQGLHEAMLRLLSSSSDSAVKYAAEYARVHARDLSFETILQLVREGGKRRIALCEDLLGSRHPRKEVGLENWGRLLDTPASQYASKAIVEHFGPSDLTFDWFKDRYLSGESGSFQFVRTNLTRVHPLKSLTPNHFLELIEGAWDPSRLEVRQASRPIWRRFPWTQLDKMKVEQIDRDRLQRLMVYPDNFFEVNGWVATGKLSPSFFDADFLKALAYEPAWETHPLVRQVVARETEHGGKIEQRDREPVSFTVLNWLRDVREFSPDDLGRDWLLELMARSEPRYQEFAEDLLIRAFVPADFADPEEADSKSDTAEVASTVDLGGQSFVFTGKLATMTRKEAQEKVKTHGGRKASSVTAKLDFLVIGDEGSPLYGEGKKGSKQVGAEQLIADGAELKIISETAFLKMLSGQAASHDADTTLAGCETLWAMAVGPGEAEDSIARFARQYIRRHHPDLAMVLTDKSVDPGAEIPESFLTFDRFRPLFDDPRKAVRDFSLEVARWELARWNPPTERLVELCESRYPAVREFVMGAFLAEDLPENRAFRLPVANLDLESVMAFCDARQTETREFGMELIYREARFQDSERLFPLVESPDRRMREFILRILWQDYRERSATEDWSPTLPPLPELGARTREKIERRREELGTGHRSRPAALPATPDRLRTLLRRVLFQIPPGKPEGSDDSETAIELTRPVGPARMAKRNLIDTLRDLAVEDEEFAAVVRPLFEEFLASKGKSEMNACLVAITRIDEAHGALV